MFNIFKKIYKLFDRKSSNNLVSNENLVKNGTNNVLNCQFFNNLNDNDKARFIETFENKGFNEMVYLIVEKIYNDKLKDKYSYDVAHHQLIERVAEYEDFIEEAIKLMKDNPNPPNLDKNDQYIPFRINFTYYLLTESLSIDLE
jgi:hypothetical protein